MPVVGSSILHVWVLGISGLAGNMSSAMKRYPDELTELTATEVVAIAEIGSTGSYTVEYTPLYAQLYDLTVTESTFSASTNWEDNVASAASAAVVDDGYCSIADAEAITQLGTPSGSTHPTEAEVLGFIAKRASQVYGRLAKYMGTAAPGPANWDTVIDTTTDQGKALSQGCRLANCIGAAIDWLAASGATEAPARSERVAELSDLYTAALDELESLAIAYGGTSNRTETAYASGEVLKGTVYPKTEQGFKVDSDTEW